MTLKLLLHKDMTVPKSKFGKAIEILLWVAALALLVENVALFRQNRRLLQVADPQITAGTQLHMLSGLAPDGHLKDVSQPPAGSRLLIITFSPQCPECQANQEGWMTLASLIERKGVRVLWVSRDSIEMTTPYCLKNGIPLARTLADPPFRTYLQLGLASVPNTILLGSDGKVEHVWVGRLDQAGWTSIFAYFGEQQQRPRVRSEVGGVTTGCGLGAFLAIAISCK